MITVKQVKKQYRDFQLDLSMELPEGRVTGLVGKNGAGKSTVLRLILGLAKPDEGSVSVFGTESRNLGVQEKERIGVSMPGSGFSGFLTGNDIWKILKKMYRNFNKSRKSPASIAKSNKQWVGTCLYQEGYKPLLINCEAVIWL